MCDTLRGGMDANELIGRFVESRIRIEAGGFELGAGVYAEYVRFCERVGLAKLCLSLRSFGLALEGRHGLRRERRSIGRGWANVRIVNDGDCTCSVCRGVGVVECSACDGQGELRG